MSSTTSVPVRRGATFSANRPAGITGSAAPVVLRAMSAAARASSSCSHGTARPPHPAATSAAFAGLRLVTTISFGASAFRWVSVSRAILPAPITSTVLSPKWSNTWRT